MKNFKLLIRGISAVCIMFVCSVIFTVYSQAATEGIFTYTVKNNAATVTKINDQGLSEIHIPETLGGYPVKFLSSNLMTASYSDNDAVYSTLYIPKTVESIDYSAFFNIYISKFVVDEENPNYLSDENGVIFNKDKTTLFRAPEEINLETYEVPEGVIRINNHAFSNCYRLKSIKFPSTLEFIGDQAFSYATGLTGIDIPNSVTEIQTNAFIFCTSLESVKIPASVKILDMSAFSECYSLKKAIVPEGITTLRSCVFENDQALEEVYLPSTITSIESGAFGNCLSLTDICFAGTQEQWDNIDIDLSEYADGREVVMDKVNVHCQIAITDYDNIRFEYQNGVLSINGEGGLPSLADTRWSYASIVSDEVTTVILDDGVSTVGEHFFESFPTLEEVIIKSPSVTISANAFDKCPKLRNVIIFGDSNFSEGSFVECSSEINIYEDIDASHEISDSVGGLNVILFSFENNILNFSGNARLTSYEFFDTIGGFCLKYENIEKVRFSDLAFEDIQFYYANEDHMLVQVEGNELKECEIYPSLTNSPDGAVTFNELINGISDSSVETFYLITSAESHDNIDNPLIEIRDAIAKAGEIILQALRWIVTLLNKLFALISKLR